MLKLDKDLIETKQFKAKKLLVESNKVKRFIAINKKKRLTQIKYLLY